MSLKILTIIKRPMGYKFLFFVIFLSSCAACNSQTDSWYKYSKIPNNLLNLVPTPDYVIPQHGFQLESVLPEGHSTSGNIDYTKVIQAALDKHRIVIFPNFPILINDNGLTISSNSKLYFQRNSELRMKPSVKGTDSKKDVYQMLLISNKKNVEIYNPTIIGDKLTHKGNVGEWSAGIYIRSSSNVLIKNARIKNSWGDGITIGRVNKLVNKQYMPSDNIRIVNSVIDNSRRNGISITCGTNIVIENSLIANSSGTLPMSGIDIEPNSAFDPTNHISLNGVITYNNERDGILLVLTKLPSKLVNNNCNIRIINHMDIGSYGGMRIGSGFRKGDKSLKGNIDIINPKWMHNYGSLRYNGGSSNELMPNVSFKNIKIINPRNAKRTLPGAKYKNGVNLNSIKKDFKGGSKLRVN